jgi:hypothetical protein
MLQNHLIEEVLINCIEASRYIQVLLTKAVFFYHASNARVENIHNVKLLLKPQGMHGT